MIESASLTAAGWDDGVVDLDSVADLTDVLTSAKTALPAAHGG